MIGTFGPVTFTSSSSAVRTFSDFQRSRSYRFAKHEVLSGKPKLEGIAPELDSVSFNMRFDMALGVDPKSELAALEATLGEAHFLMVGGTPLGLFVIEKMDEDWRRIDGAGRLLVASVSLQLTEYIE